MRYLIPLSVLIFGPAYLSASAEIGDHIEKAIAFASPILGLIAIVALLTKWRGVELFGRDFIRGFSGVFLIMTLLAGIYPVFAYAEQTLPSDYWFTFFVQFSFNLYIVSILNVRD